MFSNIVVIFSIFIVSSKGAWTCDENGLEGNRLENCKLFANLTKYLGYDHATDENNWYICGEDAVPIEGDYYYVESRPSALTKFEGDPCNLANILQDDCKQYDAKDGSGEDLLTVSCDPSGNIQEINFKEGFKDFLRDIDPLNREGGYFSDIVSDIIKNNKASDNTNIKLNFEGLNNLLVEDVCATDCVDGSVIDGVACDYHEGWWRETWDKETNAKKNVTDVPGCEKATCQNCYGETASPTLAPTNGVSSEPPTPENSNSKSPTGSSEPPTPENSNSKTPTGSSESPTSEDSSKTPTISPTTINQERPPGDNNNNANRLLSPTSLFFTILIGIIMLLKK